jgi:glycosyltransferase involved in cell wall biosynthesis
MRIASVVATLPPDIGGMGQVAFDEVKELTRRGHDVTVFTLSFGGRNYPEFPFKVVREKPLIKSGAAGLVPRWKEDLKQFDLIHLHFPFYGGAEWVWLSGRPYVVTYHMDAMPDTPFRKLVKVWYDRFFALRILQKAKRVILVDRNHKFDFAKDLFREQVAEVSNGVDTDVFRAQRGDPTSLGLYGLEGKKLYLFVGNLLPVKGLSVLLRALKHTKTDVHLIVVGGGYHEHSYRKEAVRLGVMDRVHWVGACYDQKKLAQYYAAAEAVVVPSLSESFSLVAAEAMAMERPVIASNLPGISDRVKQNETGMLFDTGSAEQLSASIDKMAALSPEERAQMGKRGRELVSMTMSLQKHVDALEAIFRSAL